LEDVDERLETLRERLTELPQEQWENRSTQ
jgi:hypothetical protein